MSALRRDPVPLPMTGLAAILIVVGLPALAVGAIVWAIGAKRRRVEAAVERLLAPYERLPHDCFRARGRVYRLQTDLNPLFSKHVSLRLSTFTPTPIDLEIRAARNVPTKTPQKLAEDPFYRRLVLDSTSPDEAVAHLLAVKGTLSSAMPSRWGAYARLHVETVLSGNAVEPQALEPDLDTLDALAAVPAARRPQGGTWTIREDFEPAPPAWHWKPEQRALLPEGARRWCVSAWYDNAYLNEPLARFLWRLAPAPRVVTFQDDLWFLEHAWGRPVPVRDHLVDLAPEMAVAADQWLDGELFAGLVAGAREDAFAGAIKFTFLDRAVASLGAGTSFFARRLFDDEFSWFSGEVEIVSATLSDEEVRRAFDTTAEEYGADVKRIERPFSFKLLKEDRLDLAF